MTNQERVNQLTNITLAQRIFLSKYIIQESKSSIKAKLNQAEDFSRRRGKVLIELSKFPNLDGLQDEVRQMLNSADELAEKGDFKPAYKLLDQVKNKAKSLSSSFDPTDLIEDIKSKANVIFDLYESAGEERINFAFWLRYYNEAANRNSTPSALTDEDLESMEELKEQLDEEWENEYSKWPHSEEFCSKASEVALLLERIPEVNRACITKGKDSGLVAIYDKLMRIQQSTETMKPDYRAIGLQVGQTRLRFCGSGSEYQTILEKFEIQTRTEVINDQNTIGSPSVQKTGTYQAFGKIDLTSILESEAINSLIRKQEGDVQLEANNLFTEWIQQQHLDVNSDEFLDLQLQSKQQFFDTILQRYLAERNLPPTTRLAKIDQKDQEQLAKIASGFMDAIFACSPNKVDEVNGTLTIGDTKFSGKQLLGKGGFGQVFRYSDQNEKVVVKELRDPTKHELMVTEVIANHQLLKGDPKAVGRDNITKMKGVARSSDGKLYMIMEEARGGDMRKLKSVMASLSQTNSLPEETRGLLNQFLLKGSVQGVQYLRDQNMVHFDLKEENIFLSEDGTPQVSDFGSVLSSETGRVGSREYGVTVGYSDPHGMEMVEVDYQIRMLKEAMGGEIPKGATGTVFEALGIPRKVMTSRQFSELKEEAKVNFLESIKPLILRKIEELESTGGGTVDSSQDSYSLGKIAQGMQFMTVPKTHYISNDEDGRFRASQPRETNANSSNMSGALNRLATALTEKDPLKRPSLEQVLKSSYLKNLDGVDEGILKELLKVMIEYGKLIDSDRISAIQLRLSPVGAGREFTSKSGKERAYGLRDQLLAIETELKKLETVDMVKHRDVVQRIAKIELEIGKTKPLQENYVAIRKEELKGIEERLKTEWEQYEIAKLEKLAVEILEELNRYPILIEELDNAEQELLEIERLLENEVETQKKIRELQDEHDRIEVEIMQLEKEIKELSEPNERAKELKQRIAELSEKLRS